jgi:hypothetical protein
MNKKEHLTIAYGLENVTLNLGDQHILLTREDFAFIVESANNQEYKKALLFFNVKCPKCLLSLDWGGVLDSGFVRCADCKRVYKLKAQEVEFSKDGKSYHEVIQPIIK